MTDSKPDPETTPGTALVVIGKPNTGLTKYEPRLAEEICVRVQLGETIQQICEDEHMPHKRTVYVWLQQHTEFRDSYRLAREEAAHVMADKVLEIAKMVTDGKITPDAGRVAIHAQQWVAGKRKPKAYGEKVEHEHTGGFEHVHRIERVIVGSGS
jgi:hypothetical protein